MFLSASKFVTGVASVLGEFNFVQRVLSSLISVLLDTIIIN